MDSRPLRRQNFYFTFGSGQSPGIGYYIIIEAMNSEDACEIMNQRWGNKWSMSYVSAETAGVERFNLRLITAFDRSEYDETKAII